MSPEFGKPWENASDPCRCTVAVALVAAAATKGPKRWLDRQAATTSRLRWREPLDSESSDMVARHLRWWQVRWFPWLGEVTILKHRGLREIGQMGSDQQ